MSSIKYLLLNLENRIYYYTIRLYNGETLVDELKLQNKGQQELTFNPAVTIDRVAFQGENNYNSYFHLMSL